MAIPNGFTPLNFNTGTTYKQEIRTRPSKYAQSDLRNWRFEQGEGIRPPEVMAPYRYLPVQFQDTNTEDWVVIPKGRVVAAIGPFDSTPVSGMALPNSSGNIVLGYSGSYAGTGTNVLTANIDTSYFGYNEFIAQLLVPANGGAIMSGFYTADDVTAVTLTAAQAVAAASGSFVLPANVPIGVTYTDIYQDIRGKYLNYNMHPDSYGILTDWYVEVPFIDYKNASSYASGCNPSYSTNNYANLTKWRDINKSFTYLAFDGTTAPKLGQLVTSDLLGNYKLQAASTVTALAASGQAPSAITIGSVTNNLMTSQTVGKLVALDTRMPKGGLDDVLTYPRSGMPGSQTAGMIKNLFDFAYYCLKIGPYGGDATAPTVEQVYNAIRYGAFGLARIQLHVS